MSVESRQDKEQLRNIIKKNAYFREKVTLSSGKVSDYYIDARLITLTSDGAYLSAKLILEAIEGLTYDAIGGPTLGADPLVGAINVLSHQQKKHLKTFIIRKKAKEHGKQRLLEGPALAKGSRVILIDDVATTGQAFIHSLDVLTALDVKVVKAVCLIDRGEGAKEALAKKGCELVSVFKAGDFHSS